jgi:pimeloyl-ACP methyl ester carboxylesterase
MLFSHGCQTRIKRVRAEPWPEDQTGVKDNSMREAVVLVHGIWMIGLEMVWLRRNIRHCGFECHQFFYRSLVSAPQTNGARLNRYLQKIDADIIHLVAHSLGGIVVLHLFEQEPMQRPGRVLMMGTPLNGSEIARRLHGLVLTRPLLGRSVIRGLLGDRPAWKETRELGMIAGTKGIGMGTLVFGGLEPPSDGTVAVRETHSPEVNVHLSVPYSHAGMLWSRRVADAVCRFLRWGDFAGFE